MGDAGRRPNRRSENSDVDRDGVVAAPGRLWRELQLARSLASAAALRCHGGCAELLRCTLPTLFSRSHAALQVWSQKRRRKARQARRAQSGCDSALGMPYQRRARQRANNTPMQHTRLTRWPARERWRGRRQGKPVGAPLRLYASTDSSLSKLPRASIRSRLTSHGAPIPQSNGESEPELLIA